MLIDVNAYLGHWPFSAAPRRRPGEFAEHLARSGIKRAVVSPLDAVLAPEPMTANAYLFDAARHIRAFAPLPIVNPALANWREQLEACRVAGARAVRILPNYHNYRLRNARLAEFMDALAAAKLQLVLTVRLEDERQRYFALNIRGVPVAELTEFLQRFPKHHVLCTGLSLGETTLLAAKADNFSIDLAYVEHNELAPRLRQLLPARRVMFGTLAPMLSPEAQRAKLTTDYFTAAERARIGVANAREFFSL